VAGFRSAAREGFASFAALIAQFRAKAVDASVDELLRELVDAIRYHDHLRAEGPEGLDRIENVRELIAGAAEVVADDGGEVGLTPLDHFLQQATLVAGSDALDPSADAVTMMTMHNAKGLEYPLVFVTGLEDGLFPHARESDVPSFVADEEASQDQPNFTKGERVTHGRFGSGTIAELSGAGKEAKVTVDFDDESVGRKRLVIAFAGLQRAFE
jgi:DNA helicase II / ATP-dependent DNA helicase PcrA